MPEGSTAPCQGSDALQPPPQPDPSSISPERPRGCLDVSVLEGRADFRHTAKGEAQRRGEIPAGPLRRCCTSGGVLEKRDHLASGKQKKLRWKSHVERDRSCLDLIAEGGAKFV